MPRKRSRTRIRVSVGLALAGLVLSSLAVSQAAFARQERAAGAIAAGRPIVRSAVAHATSRRLSKLVEHPLAAIPMPGEQHIPSLIEPGTGHDAVDAALDRSTPLDTMPQPIRTFEGNAGTDNDGLVVGPAEVNFILPPDTNGDVGPNHYVQWVNGVMSVWTKDGTRIFGPVNGNTIFSDLGGICSTANDGDPVVQYDQLAQRWMISQFAVPGGATGYHECIAVSTSPDPTGSYHLYDFKLSSTIFTDYPHFGVWPDGYYMSINQFTSNYVGPGAVVFERDAMLAGAKARFVYFTEGQNASLTAQLPSDLDGVNPPPAGSPNYFVSSTDGAPDHLNVYRFHVDWSAPASKSTFTGPTVLPVAEFDSGMCEATYEKGVGGDNRSCIPQPGWPVGLDPISDRVMYRLAYRNFGDHEALVANQTVDADGNEHAGIRWYELQKSGADDWTVHQQSTYAPQLSAGGLLDLNHRWMGSIAMDSSGNIAVGYSMSGHATFPSLAYTGRLATDPLNTMPQGEVTMFAGGGSQNFPIQRWGDYSSMSIDPTDDCTFWYTNEYYPLAPEENGNVSPWHTRIGSFRFPQCGADVRPYVDPDTLHVGLGRTFTYTLHVANNGPGTAQDMSLRDEISPGMTVVSANVDQGSCNVTANTVACTLGTLAGGGFVTVDVVMTAAQTGTMTNTATVSSGTRDPNPDNNVGVSTIVVS
ncbi:MAG: DUF11 domain-containing protein [Actinomycetota bacterium]